MDSHTPADMVRSLQGRIVAVLCLCVTSLAASASAGTNMLSNAGFEKWDNETAQNWNNLWTRDKDVGSLAVDRTTVHDGSHSVRIEHKGKRDWSFNYHEHFPVKPGDLFEFTGWVYRKGPGDAILCVTAYDAKGQALDWSLGGRYARREGQWQLVRCAFVAPDKVVAIHPRLIGQGPATIWLDDVHLAKTGNVADLQRSAPAKLRLSNPLLDVQFDTADAVLTVTDKRGNHTWTQESLHKEMIVIKAEAKAGRIDAIALHAPSGRRYDITIDVEPNEPELVLSIASQEPQLQRALHFPHPFVTDPGTYLVVPMNEGISYPVDDPSIPPARLIAYGGHGICMAFWGVTDGQTGHMAIIETPDDAAIHIRRAQDRLCIGPEWESQKGQFGYVRKLRYVFFDKGGHVAICKHYRQHAKDAGLFKTLRQKLTENPDVDLLVGAVNVWCWDSDALSIVRQMRAAGIERILWSHRRSPDVIKAMNNIDGVLTSRYDIYQDLMDSKVVAEQLRGLHPDWTQAGWPKDIMLDVTGDWRKGWRVRGKDGKMYPCAVLCDRQAVKYAQERIGQELKTHPYRCRFIDTTTASPWRECYDPAHPMTRSDSKHWKMQLLRYVSEDAHLVTGSETGHDAAVPYVHYFEGMLSLGPYRVPDAGRQMRKIWTDVPDRVAKFQLGHRYRLPLWELVYHDCVIAQWYWGDYNNKLPALWDKRDLFNILYGTPPMFMFTRDYWQQNKDRFARSYKNTCPVVRAVGYSEMVNHELLTRDRDVQRTSFANGVAVTVNFGRQTRRLADGTQLLPMTYRVTGMTTEQ